MRLSDVLIITFAIVGLTSIITPMDEPTPEVWNAMIMAFRACLIIVVIEILPRIIKKLGSNGLTDVLLSAVPCVAVLIGIYFVVPDADPDLITNLMIVALFVSMVAVKIVRRHFVKKYGVKVASSEKDEIHNYGRC